MGTRERYYAQCDQQGYHCSGPICLTCGNCQAHCWNLVQCDATRDGCACCGDQGTIGDGGYVACPACGEGKL